MSLERYLTETEKHLERLSGEERKEAISFYAEYAAEAGITGFDGMQARFGSPKELAAGIYAEAAVRQVQGTDPSKRKVLRGFLTGLTALAALPLSLPVLIAAGSIAFALTVSAGAVFLSLLLAAAGTALSGAAALAASFRYLVPFQPALWLTAFGGALMACALGCMAGMLLFLLTRKLMTRLTLIFTNYIKRRTKHEA